MTGTTVTAGEAVTTGAADAERSRVGQGRMSDGVPTSTLVASVLVSTSVSTARPTHQPTALTGGNRNRCLTTGAHGPRANDAVDRVSRRIATRASLTIRLVV